MENTTTEENILETLKQDFGILVEAGFVAVKQGDEINAQKLFKAAQELNPTHTAPNIGFGYISLNKLEITDAIETFEKVVKKESTNYLATTFLGLCLMIGKVDMDRGSSLVEEALEKSEDESIRLFAQTTLGWKKEYFEKSNTTVEKR